MLDLPFPKNPDYGKGATRRRIHLWISEGCVRGLLVDIFHEMECTILHDGATVKSINGLMHRVPNSSCPAAPSILPQLIGMSVGISAGEFYKDDRIRQHCTHLFDLAFYVIAHAGADFGEIVYEALVPDKAPGDSDIDVSVWREGGNTMEWRVRHGLIVKPAALEGCPVVRGFSAWAEKMFSREEFFLAQLLSRTFLLAQGRPYLIDAWPGQPIERIGDLQGVCFAYDAKRLKKSVFVEGNVRDFSDGIVEGS